jgi:ABC-type Zn uptake system ZnuABC Zn-binding protein ZnuA
MVFGGVVLALLVSLGCTTVDDPWPADAGDRPKVLTSFAPLTCFAKNVGGDDVVVLSLLTTHGPHDYSYDAKDLAPLKRANLFVINGLSLEEKFFRKLKDNSGNSGLKLIDLGAAAIPKGERLQLNLRHGDHTHSGDDPHIWLGIPEAKKLVAELAKVFSGVDPKNAAKYQKRAADYSAKLDKLLEEGQEAIKPVKEEDRKIVTTHDAFQYFARTFGVTIESIIQPQPGKSLDFKDLDNLVNLCKDKGVRVITTEPQYPTRDAEELLRRVRGKLEGKPSPVLAQLDPLETATAEDLVDLDWYENKMRQNIKNLTDAFAKYGSEK